MARAAWLMVKHAVGQKKGRRFHIKQRTLILIAIGSTILLSSYQRPSLVVVQSRGVDPRVDYAALAQYGPWDDRNYQLTAADVARFASNEAELTEGIPAFYRAELRRRIPDLPREGEVQYSREVLPWFLYEYGGLLVEGKVYTKWNRAEIGWKIDMANEAPTIEEFALQRTLEAEVRVTSPEGGNESAVAISPTNPNRVIAGSNGPGSGQKMHYSTDGGATWNPSAALPLGGGCCDPTVAWSSDGTKAYTATLGLPGLFVYRSGDGGQTWTDFDTETGGSPRRNVAGAALADRDYLHVDQHPTSPYLDNLYIVWGQDNKRIVFGRSEDSFSTWTTQAFSGDPRGYGSHIVTDKAGKIYVFWHDYAGASIVFKESLNGGDFFESGVTTIAQTISTFDFPIPSIESRRVGIYVSAAADLTDGIWSNSIYATWTDTTGPESGTAADNHARIRVAYSRDGGQTWTETTPHSTDDSDSVDRWNPWMVVGPDGRVYVMFYDTMDDRTSVDAFYSMSEDGAQTWSTPIRLTSATSPNITNGQEFADYNGMDIALAKLVVLWTDNRSESGGTGDSVDIYAAVVNVDPMSIFADGFEGGDTLRWSSTSRGAR